MKKNKLGSLALMGISMGLMTLGYAQGSTEPMSKDMKAFYQMLTPDAQKKFLELDATHRKTALQIYNEYCKAENQCKGHREEAVEEQYTNQMQQRQKLNQEIKKP